MRKNLFAAATVSALLALSMGCATANSTQGNQAEMAAKEVITEAKSFNEMARAKNFEWKSTSSYIKKAEEAMAKGDYALALDLAEHARLEGKMAYQQSIEQAGAEAH